MQVVREQITRALAMKPSSLDQLKNKLRGLNYSEILRLRQSERMSQDDFQSPPIMSVYAYTTSNCTVRVLTWPFLDFALNLVPFSLQQIMFVVTTLISNPYPSLFL